ncbi:MAG: hypothetical protein R3Y56_09765, partial [Akkermansia sp.]
CGLSPDGFRGRQTWRVAQCLVCYADLCLASGEGKFDDCRWQVSRRAFVVMLLRSTVRESDRRLVGRLDRSEATCPKG